MCTILFFSSRRRHTRCALVTEFRRVLFRSAGGRALIEDPGCPVMRKGLNLAGVEAVPVPVGADGMQVDLGIRIAPDAALARSEERRVGKEGVSTCSTRWLANH